MNKIVNGFTLMEVMVALMILAIALTASFSNLSGTLKSQHYIENKTAATWVGLNVIARAEIGILRFNQHNSSISNTEMMFNQNWSWFAHTEATDNPHVLMLIVEVKSIANSATIATLVGYLYNAI